MELLIFLLAAVCVVVFLLWRTPPANGSDRQPIPPKRYTPKASERPFDAQSRTPLPVDTTLKGSAYVVDGDTVVIKKTQIRLFGVDAPEINHPYGRNAKWALVALCKGQTIRAEMTAQDDHGRTVARCYLSDGRDLSAEMVKLGLAIDWPKFSGGIYKEFEVPDARKKMWLADARQKGRMHVWEKFEAAQANRANSN